MDAKTKKEIEERNNAMDTTMVLLEILAQLDDIDLLGRGFDLKLKVINRIEEEIDKI